MKKALVCAHVASMIQQFNMENIRLLLQLGYTVDVICNMEQTGGITPEKAKEMQQQLTAMGVGVYHMPAPKKVTAVGDIMHSFGIVRRLMREKRYDLVHCHSPIGGAICRAANRVSGSYQKTKMIYTAHGFHFYQGAPLINWLLYYPIEKLCAHWTDVLITINREDHQLAEKEMSAGENVYIPGVGVNTEKFYAPQLRIAKREELGIPADAFLLLSVGELNANKNHQIVIRAMAQVAQSNLHYAIAGKGALAEELKALAESCGVAERVHVLGFRTDVPELYPAADLFVFPSYREGLPVSVMEAMAAGKAVIGTKIRGNTDLIDEGEGGYLLAADVTEFTDAIARFVQDSALVQQMGEYNRVRAAGFDVRQIMEQLREIYTQS